MAVIFPIFMNVFQKIKETNLSEALLILILVSLPLGGYAINSIAIVLFLLSAIFNYFVNKEKIRFHKIALLFIIFYIVCFASLLWTDDINITKAGLSRFLSYLVLPLSFVFFSNKKFHKEKIIELFSKSLVFYAGYCIFLGSINSIVNSDISYLFYHKLSNNLSNLNAIYLSVFVSFGISFFLNKKEKSKFEMFCLAFLSLFLILLSSKIIILITFLTFIFLLFKKRKYTKIKVKYLLIIPVISLFFLVASTNLFKRVKVEFEKTKITEVLNKKEFGHVYLWTGAGLRVFQIKAFFEILKEEKNIFLGFGLNNSQKTLNTKYKEYNLYPGFLNYNYHNQYLQVFSELGVIGLGVLLLIFFLIIKDAIIYKDYFLLSFIILILVVCITESFLWRQRGMVFFITISLLFSQRKKFSI
ncbi:oligosaccharide repeat unit polymerase [Polaribacter sp. MSW13]|uniref:Oligosaccharide repeat unit polymerase n=1 Tax=Polaribacter marinus TaxID=2916838 RepID=A0A9X1VN25_9FLAO|nr:O-antigen polymerase [Polaribacter marinus]MCI2228623.1 oligosaccharide repeat unit polymerase [Polaribacter marinus]